MRICTRVLYGLAVGLLTVSTQALSAFGANAYPVFTDIDAAPQAFGVASAGEFGGLYTLDSAATLNDNAVLGINQNGALPCCHGALIEINVSNGENGVDSTEFGTNIDIPNPTPPNSVFATIGNASGKLENGNVIRFSAWFRSDPANPITLDPQVQPILKIEYWKEALSSNQDANFAQDFPQFGDRLFDQDQQGSSLGIPDLPHWIDLDGDGFVLDGSATVANGRVTQISTSEWRLAEVTHTVNSFDFLGIGGEAFGFRDVSVIESVKAVMFMGDFAQTDLTGDGVDGGNLLVDNALVEVFKDAASVTPNVNPNPTLSEGLLGDYNDNGIVDAADYTVYRDNLGTTAILPNDPIGGVIGPAHYTQWKDNFGSTAGSGSLSTAAVPEPTSLLLFALGLVGACVGPRRR